MVTLKYTFHKPLMAKWQKGFQLDVKRGLVWCTDISALILECTDGDVEGGKGC
jgi:hypothetical protein